MQCTEVESLLGHYLSEQLDLRRRRTVEKHLKACLSCQRVLAEERELHILLADPELHVLADQLDEGLLMGAALDAGTPLPEPAPLPDDFTARVLARLEAETLAPSPDEALCILLPEPGVESESQAADSESLYNWLVRTVRHWSQERWGGAGLISTAAAAVAVIWVGAPLWHQAFTAVMHSPVGTALSPVVGKANQAEAVAAATLANLKVFGLQLQVMLHQVL